MVKASLQISAQGLGRNLRQQKIAQQADHNAVCKRNELHCMGDRGPLRPHKSWSDGRRKEERKRKSAHLLQAAEAAPAAAVVLPQEKRRRRRLPIPLIQTRFSLASPPFSFISYAFSTYRSHPSEPPTLQWSEPSIPSFRAERPTVCATRPDLDQPATIPYRTIPYRTIPTVPDT